MVNESIQRMAEEAKTNPYVWGVVPSEIKVEDYQAVAPSAAPSSAPERFSFGALGRLPVSDQVGGTCTGHAIGNIMSALQYEESKRLVLFDGEEVHNRVVHNLTHGAMPNTAMEEVRLHGAASHEGLYFLKAYGWVDFKNVDLMKATIASGQPMLLAVWLTKAFVDSWYQKTMPIFRAAPGEDYGYHAMGVLGYTPDGLLVQNSWSDRWALQGTGILSWDYLAAHTGEAWSVTDQPDAEEGFVKHEFQVVKPRDDHRPTRVARRGGMPAVWAIYDGGRFWVQSKAHAAQMGIDLTKVENIPSTNTVWTLPIIGRIPTGEKQVG